MDEIDRAQEAEEQHRELALARARCATKRASIDGYCEDCGEPIPAARLAAVPTASRCIDCQEKAERRS